MSATDTRSLNERIDALGAQFKGLGEELRKARLPHYDFGGARRTIAKFGPAQRGGEEATGGFGSFGDFCKSVRNAGGDPGRDPKLSKWLTKAAPLGLGESVGADGGYLVPPQFAQELLQRVYDNDLLGRTTMFPMTSNSLKIPAINETSRADGSRFGGVQAFWRREAEEVTRTKPKFDLISLDLGALTVMVQATDELIEDAAPALETYIDTVVAQEFAFKIGDAIVNGLGAGMPEGLLNSPAKITVAKESGQAANTLVAANVVNMWSRLHPACRQGAVWLYDQSIEPQLFTMTVGTGGANLAVFLPPGGLSSAPFGTLLGRPLIPTEFNKPLGTEGDLILTDLSTYLTGSKGGMQSAVSMHVLFLTSEQVFRFTMRMDGKPWWKTPLTPKSGGPTQSCIVTLETRSS